jgi:hypothetical protein
MHVYGDALISRRRRFERTAVGLLDEIEEKPHAVQMSGTDFLEFAAAVFPKTGQSPGNARQIITGKRFVVRFQTLQISAKKVPQLKSYCVWPKL